MKLMRFEFAPRAVLTLAKNNIFLIHACALWSTNKAVKALAETGFINEWHKAVMPDDVPTLEVSLTHEEVNQVREALVLLPPNDANWTGHNIRREVLSKDLRDIASALEMLKLLKLDYVGNVAVGDPS